MAKTVIVDGVKHVFPDDATDAEINAAIPAPAKQTLDPNQPGMQPAGSLGKAWDWFSSKPLLDNILPDGAKTGDLVRATVFQHLTGEPYIPGINDFDTKSQTTLKDSPTMAAIKAGVFGASKDTADTGTSFTTPLSISTLALGAAGKGAGAVGKIASAGNKVISAGMAGKGAYDIATDDGSGTLPERAKRYLSNAAMVSGGAAGATPADSIGNALENKSYGTMNNLLGVYGRDMKYGINPGRGVVQEGIAGANKNSILNKIDARIPQLSDELNTTANSPAMAGRTVDLTRSVNEPFDIALAKGDQQPSSYLNRLLQTKKELTQERTVNGSDKVEFTGQPVNLQNMNVADALGFKQGVGRRTLFDTDSEGVNVNPTLKEVYGRSNADIRGVAPEIAPTLDRLADLTTAGGSLNSTIGRRLANPSSGIKDVAPAVGGATLGGAPLAAGAIIGRELFSSTPVKSYGAQLMFKAGRNLKTAKPGTPTYGALAAAMAANAANGR